MTDTELDRVAPGYLGDGVSPSHNDKNLHHILTDEERAAILTAADLLIGSRPGAVLRKLLERLK